MVLVIWTFALSAIVVSAIPQLEMSISTPSSSVDIDGLVVKTMLKNTGDESLKLLNNPNTVLSQAPTDTFDIESESGSPDFTGVWLKYVPAAAAAAGGESDFTLLEVGKSIEISHSLAGVYNFTRSGAGAYNLGSGTLFHYVHASGELKTIEAVSNSRSSGFEISGKLVAPSPEPPGTELKKRIVTYRGCTAVEQGDVSASVTGAATYARGAIDYLARISSGTNRYKTWFGAYTTARLGKVRSHFANMDVYARNTQYDCVTCLTNPPRGTSYASTFAYVYVNQKERIYLCGLYWKAPSAGTDSKSGTIVHELSHFAGTSDVKDRYGQSGSKELARTQPDKAVMTADNHEYFAENTPFLA